MTRPTITTGPPRLKNPITSAITPISIASSETGNGPNSPSGRSPSRPVDAIPAAARVPPRLGAAHAPDGAAMTLANRPVGICGACANVAWTFWEATFDEHNVPTWRPVSHACSVWPRSEPCWSWRAASRAAVGAGRRRSGQRRAARRQRLLPLQPGGPTLAATRAERRDGRAKAQGFPLKVALIAAPTDLGVIPDLFGKPQSYAQFLDQEISFTSRQRLLVVMAAGYGLEGFDGSAQAAVRGLPKPAGATSTDLARAALVAVPRVAAAEGPSASGEFPAAPAPVGGSGSRAATVIGLAAAALWSPRRSLVLRRRPSRTSRLTAVNRGAVNPNGAPGPERAQLGDPVDSGSPAGGAAGRRAPRSASPAPPPAPSGGLQAHPARAGRRPRTRAACRRRTRAPHRRRPRSRAEPPAAIAARNTGRRSGSPSRCTDRLPGSRPSPSTAAGAPPLLVTPPRNQHIAPALSPASTIPRSHAARIAASTPCSRQIASMLRIEPPPT